MRKIIYAATPIRMVHAKDSICEFITEAGHFPFHPLQALPPEKYNIYTQAKQDIYRVCFGIIGICDELWLFGIGGGSIREYQYAKNIGKSLKSFVKRFDPDWQTYSLRDKYSAFWQEISSSDDIQIDIKL